MVKEKQDEDDGGRMAEPKLKNAGRKIIQKRAEHKHKKDGVGSG